MGRVFFFLCRLVFLLGCVGIGWSRVGYSEPLAEVAPLNGLPASPGPSVILSPLDAAQLKVELGRALGQPALASAQVGFLVTVLGSGQVLYAKNAEKLLSPASNMKLITTAAALHYLRPEFRFKTEVFADGPLEQGTVAGNLYVRGGGDPALVSERVWFLANELAHLGLKHVSGSVIGDDTYFDEKREQSGWDEDTSDGAYQALTSGLSVNYNTITVRVLPGMKPGTKAAVAFDPPTPFASLDSSVVTDASRRSRVAVDVIPVEATHLNLIKVIGRINQYDPGRAFWRKVDYPTEFSTAAIASFLNQAGVTIDHGSKRGVVPESARRLMAVESPRLAEIVDELNKTSNNFISEQILKTLGAELLTPPGSADKGLQVLRRYLGELGIDERSYTIRNGSGLGDVNRVTPAQIVTVLSAAFHDPAIRIEYMNSLGVAGASGTVRHRMQGGPAAYRVRAKTGSLAGACTLSGYVYAAGGETLAFSLLVNGFRKMRAVHDAQDRIAELLSRYAEAPKAESLSGAAKADAAKVANDGR